MTTPSGWCTKKLKRLFKMSLLTFDRQNAVSKALQNALEKSKLSHGLLFQGPSHTGQIEMAKELAKALFCEKKGSLGSCESCTHCRQVNKNSHPDFMEIGRASCRERV